MNRRAPSACARRQGCEGIRARRADDGTDGRRAAGSDASGSGLLESLTRALVAGDADGIRSVLRSDVVLVVDSGSVPSSPRITDADSAVAALVALARSGTTVRPASVNGRAGIVLMRADAVVAVLAVEVRAGLLSQFWVVSNPEKLRHWNRS